jgi:FAD/FMN-containing dehydrogenase
MDLTTEISSPGTATARDLRTVMQGKIVLPTDADYLRVRQTWNGAVPHLPAVFAKCRTRDDVRAAVCAARVHDLPLSVRGGGHDWAGRSLRHNGLVIALTEMRSVKIDAEARIANMAGGATANDVITAAAQHGLVAVTGNCGSVGMTGLTLGGGFGQLSPRSGLASDNLLGAELILADGRCISVHAAEHPDLFWARRGGGSNFGVVTYPDNVFSAIPLAV